MKDKRKILVVTGTRADYGLLKHVIKEIFNHSQLELCLVATGSHLSKKLGMTINEILEDGFFVSHKLEILDDSNPNQSVSEISANALKGFGEIINVAKPEIMLVLGDRYESFAATVAATLSNIPVAHIHGGELTYGAIDDAFRHSMTKMAWWHFTTTAEYQKRVIHLGEDPQRVYNVGAPAIDGIASKLATQEEIERFVGKSLRKPVALVTLHPETRSPGQSLAHIRCLLDALSPSNLGTVIFTKANADDEGAIINDAIGEYVIGKENMVLVSSLGQKRYLGLMKLADLAIGNSSSLLIEAPILGTPAVNIGSRQDGRVRSSAVIDVAFDTNLISHAIKKALAPDFKLHLAYSGHPYGEPGVATKIVNILANDPIPESLAKRFYE